MNRKLNAVLFILTAISLGSWTIPVDSWTSLFNGKDFSGWKQLNGNAKYTVENGAVVGTSALNTPNSFMATEKEYGDFILEFEVKVDSGLNSGVQIRSHSVASFKEGRVHGYQVEIDPSDRAWSGGLYDEARRGWLYPLEQNPMGRKAFLQHQWNHYRIEAIGRSIRTWVNGVACTDFIDTLNEKGFIALQVHSIGDKEQEGKQVRWKNIHIQTENLVPSPWTNIPVVNLEQNTLSPQERANGWMLLFDGKTTTGWRGAGKDKFPEKGWVVKNGTLMVAKSTGAEAQNGGDIVTMEEFDMFELSLEFKLTPGANSGIKYYITEKYGTGGSAIGLEYQLLDDEKHPDAKAGAAGNRTVASLYDLIPAASTKQVNTPGQWNHARLIVSGVRNEEWIRGNQLVKSSFKGAHVEHWLNHKKVLSYERGNQAFKALVARSKYAQWEGFGDWQSGRILLQDHGDEVYFRNIKIRRIN